MPIKSTMQTTWQRGEASLNGAGQASSLLLLRVLLAWEFGEAGWQKYMGQNWFASIQGDFPWPFNVIPASLSWHLATATELLAAVFLVLGLATRFTAIALLMLTIVATAAVHWPDQWSTLSELWQGYAISDNGYGNYKLPLMLAVMLTIVIAHGPGRLSVDQCLRGLWQGAPKIDAPRYDGVAWAIVLMVFGLPLIWLQLWWGIAALVLATSCLAFAVRRAQNGGAA